MDRGNHKLPFKTSIAKTKHYVCRKYATLQNNKEDLPDDVKYVDNQGIVVREGLSITSYINTRNIHI